MNILNLLNINERYKKNILEIRIRANSKVLIYLLVNNEIVERFLNVNGELVLNDSDGIEISQCKLNNIINTLLEYSIENHKNEITNGFFTLKDGSRVGISGEVCFEDGKIKSFKKITSLNIRFAKHIKNCSVEILKEIIKDDNNIHNTLIVSSPMCGKTTLIRDLAIKLADGYLFQEYKLSPMNVGIVDERFEINIDSIKRNVNRIDVLSGINKIFGSELLIRSMNPKVIILDEIGLKDDFFNLERIINSGVSFIATMHGRDKFEIKNKLKEFRYLFEKIILLSKSNDNEKFFKYEVIDIE